MSKHIIVWTEDGKRRRLEYLLHSTALIMWRELLRQCYFDARIFKVKS